MGTEFGIETSDERTHKPDSDAAWRESFWVDVVDPRTGTGLLAYVGVQPGIGSGYGLVHIADRSGVRFQYRNYALSVGEYREGAAAVHVGPFQVATDPQTGATRLQFSHEGSAVEVKFSSANVVYDYPWPWTWSRHYEQLGEATAIIEGVEQAPVELHGAAARDHAWGLRSLRGWRGWLWVTSRATEGGPSWTVCWAEDEEFTQVFGHLIDESGTAHRVVGLAADVHYGADDTPRGARLELSVEDHGPVHVELETYGLIDLSHADAAKRGGYYFSFHDAQTEGAPGAGTFDVFWREGLDPWRSLKVEGPDPRRR